jgi:hypothetical protein
MKLYWTTDLAAWDDLSRSCPAATFFHRGAWLGAAADTTGGRFEAALCDWPDGAVALVPMVHRRTLGGLSAEGVSGEIGRFASYGGLIGPRPLPIEAVDEVFRAIARVVPDLRVVGNPHARAPHLPTEAGGRTALAEPVHLLALGTRPDTPLAADQTLDWVPGPQHFHADLFGSLETPEQSRPRAFYHHLFRRSGDESLGMLVLRALGRPVAGLLVGLDGAIAYNLALVGPDVHHRLLVDHLGRHVGPAVRCLDLGPAARPPLGWPAERRASLPLTTWWRPSAPTTWLTRMRRNGQRVS